MPEPDPSWRTKPRRPIAGPNPCPWVKLRSSRPHVFFALGSGVHAIRPCGQGKPGREDFANTVDGNAVRTLSAAVGRPTPDAWPQLGSV